jgi:hypothetical protein
LSIIVPQITLGGVLLTLLEPAPGTAREFNRWYEGDHFYAGCMMGKNFFSARRWLATAELKQLRFPNPSPLASELSQGSFLAVYWLLAEDLDESIQWSINQVLALNAQGRMQPPRQNVSTGFYDYRWGCLRDPDGVSAELALEHPFAGISMSLIDLPEDSEESVFDDVCQQLVSGQMKGTDWALSLCLKPRPMPERVPDYVPRTDPNILSRRRLLLNFFDSCPDQGWQQAALRLAAALASEVRSTTVFSAPFRPTIPGTDCYIDEL